MIVFARPVQYKSILFILLLLT